MPFSVRVLSQLLLAIVLVLVSGCGGVRETFPARTAQEQILLSTAADRAVEPIEKAELAGRSVFVDATNLDCYDKPYVVERIRQAVVIAGGRLASSRPTCQSVLEVASGALSVDKNEFLIGIPSITAPIPLTQANVQLPELALFKIKYLTGRAKLLFVFSDGPTGREAIRMPPCYGKVSDTYYWVLLTGPYRSSDLPPQAR